MKRDSSVNRQAPLVRSLLTWMLSLLIHDYNAALFNIGDNVSEIQLSETTTITEMLSKRFICSGDLEHLC